MNNFDIFAFSICLIAGFFRVHQIVAYLGIALLAGLVFVIVHQRSGPWGLVDPNLQTSALVVLTMVALYVTTYWIGRLAAKFKA